MALVGPIAGALVAGGVYYGFSNLIQTRTDQIRQDQVSSQPPDPPSHFPYDFPRPFIESPETSLHTLSSRLADSPTVINAPPSAASRITPRPWSSYVQSQWNQEIAYLFTGFREWDRRASEWGRKVLYGERTAGDKS